MDQHNIDRLFREKLDGLEVTPTPQAWSEVERKLGGKKKPMIYWVAASIALLLAASLILWPDQATNYQLAMDEIDIDHPILPDNQSLSTPVAITLEKEDKKNARNESSKKSFEKRTAVQLAQVESIEKSDNSNPSKSIELEIKKMVALEETSMITPVSLEPPSEEVIEEEVSYNAVKITYIASEPSEIEDKAKNDSTGVLKKFIAFTEKIDPGEMLADIKTAKDNLLNGGLKNKRTRSAMIP